MRIAILTDSNSVELMLSLNFRLLFFGVLVYALYVGNIYLIAGISFTLAEEYVVQLPKLLFWAVITVVLGFAANAFLDRAFFSGAILVVTSIAMGMNYLDREKKKLPNG